MCDCYETDPGKYIIDSREGSTICTQCGVVVDNLMLEFAPDWQGNEVRENMHHTPGTRFEGRRVPRILNHVPASSRTLLDGIKRIESVVAEYRLTERVCEDAKMVLRDVSALRAVRSDTVHAFAAAALFFGFKMQGAEMCRSLEEVASMCKSPKESLNTMTKTFKDDLVGKPYHASMLEALQPRDLVIRASQCIPLDIAQCNVVRKRAYRLLDTIFERGVLVSKSPQGVCGAVMWVAVHEAGFAEACPRTAVEKAVGVSGVTLVNLVKQLVGYGIAPASAQPNKKRVHQS